MFGPALGGVLSGLDMRAPALAAAGLVALNAMFVARCLPEFFAADRRFHWLAVPACACPWSPPTAAAVLVSLPVPLADQSA